MIALATVLSYVKILDLPQGGSLTAGSMIPILLIGFRYGLKKGLFVGAVHGLLQALLQGYIIHPVQFIFDYPLAFGLLGLTGIFTTQLAKPDLAKSKKYAFVITGTLIAAFGRFACHVVSGSIFFKEYAGAQNPWVYSAVYNGSYMLAEFALSAVVLALLWKALERTIIRR